MCSNWKRSDLEEEEDDGWVGKEEDDGWVGTDVPPPLPLAPILLLLLLLQLLILLLLMLLPLLLPILLPHSLVLITSFAT